ncbi:MAG: Smr/MutS family protein, partial [Candidatus Xenobia bacterium]
FGATFPGAMNAAVEFDEETLRPTYRLEIGLPGRSCALIISQRLGMPDEVLRRARALMGEAHLEVEELVEHLELQREDAEKREVELHHALMRARQLEADYESRLRALQAERSQILAEALREAEGLVEGTREELKATVRDARQKVSALRAEDSEEIAGLERTGRSHLEAAMERIQEKRQQQGLAEQPAVRRYEPGDRVRVRRLSQEGTVVSAGRGSLVSVMVGSVRMSLSPGELEYLGKGSKKMASMTVEAPRAGAQSQSLRLDLRGMRADDAVYEVEKFIDRAARTSAPSFMIVHGKGQGVLRKVVHDYLKECPAVESFRLGDSHEGGWGATVVMLK